LWTITEVSILAMSSWPLGKYVAIVSENQFFFHILG
jgi:hypothetical protein